jgi:hypothetical protein
VSSSLPLFEKVFDGDPLVKQSITGKGLRDSGMDRVLRYTSDAWKQLFKDRIRGFPKGLTFTIEQVVEGIGGRPPEVHPNASGAMTHGLAKAGVIRRTGRTVKTRRASRRSADTTEWVRM